MGLPAYWRQKAKEQIRATVVASNDLGIRYTLLVCAEDLELALHQDKHDAEFDGGCGFCDWERIHNEDYPERGE